MALWAVGFFLFTQKAGALAPPDDGDRIPDVFVDLGEGDRVQRAVLVDKSAQSLFLYEFDGKLSRRLSFQCSTGEAAGDKKVAGDKKTPEGIYFFIRKHPRHDLTPIYGSYAFPMDYPNFLDRASGKTGSAIWLHGTNKPIEPMDSNGCVALANPDIEALSDYITLGRTPAAIVEKISYVPAEELARRKSAAARFLSRWAASISGSAYHDYLEFYDPAYAPDIRWWNTWNAIRNFLGAGPAAFEMGMKNRVILKHKDIYTVTFDLFFKIDGVSVPIGFKKLFLSEKSGALKIVGDVYGHEEKKSASDENPLLPAARRVRKIAAAASEKKNIAGMIDQWIRAWSQKDIRRYGGFYAGDFKSGRMDKKKWLRHKESLNLKYAYIRVSKDRLDVKVGGDRAEADFVQTYESPLYRAVGKKKLVLKREGTGWKIYREIWEAL
ncbi:conserved hypothetical protein [Candidatus Desulfarcum epimagneticum]|uniref:L,D-TPase catalytic domain-containing protein n=1 Tax=uncultured Desulfobacteraceae bacterium TaxID=218296 RepID=A0A484HI79_9BACT|nr:conserved hypothetical protein [uncultured Desulfobacteraceae bacterium]